MFVSCLMCVHRILTSTYPIVSAVLSHWSTIGLQCLSFHKGAEKVYLGVGWRTVHRASGYLCRRYSGADPSPLCRTKPALFVLVLPNMSQQKNDITA